MLEETLRKALRVALEASVDTGVADDTSTVNYLDDISKSWPTDAFVNLIVEITGGTGEDQIRKIASNTATRITPVTAFDTAPDSTSTYRIGFFGKMASDITAWGGTALTGRDISLDLANLDITLSALRDALRQQTQNVETLVPLGIAGTFTGASRDCINHGDFCVSCFADQVGTLYVENSQDNVTWRTHDTVAIAINTPVNRVYAVTMRYNRVRYLNGAAAQTVFELVTLQRPIGG